MATPGPRDIHRCPGRGLAAGDFGCPRRRGRIFCQLWHTGRVSHEALHPGGRQSPLQRWSAISARRSSRSTVSDGGWRPRRRALTMPEIESTVQDYGAASRRAFAAGFDGVEVHGANGYLLHQFVAANVNDRDDDYGGSVENRCRFTLEAVDAAIAEVGAGRVGLRISPLFSFSGIDDPDPGPAFRYIAEEMSARGIAYLHIADTNTMAPRSTPVMAELLALMADTFDGPVVLNGGYDAERARRDIEAGDAAAIAFGRAFLANPDLPQRLAKGLPLNPPNFRTFYGGGAEGYTDYPEWQPA